MLCKKPYMINNMPCPCGRCMPCRINHKRLWTHRLMLESLKHAHQSFVTLTYDNEHLPADGSLNPEHTRLWLMRLRSALLEYSARNKIPPIRIRYYLVGEYGDETHRPHYHLALFGIGSEFEEIIASTWGKGHVMCAEFNLHTAQYICGYVTKKMTSKDDPRLNGKYPEFVRMSRRGGIGMLAAIDIVDLLTTKHGCNHLEKVGDVPYSLNHGGRAFPLGRYLRRRIRETLGMPQEWKEKNLREYTENLRAMWQVERDAPQYSPDAKVSLRTFLLEKYAGKVKSLEVRSKIYKQRKTL